SSSLNNVVWQTVGPVSPFALTIGNGSGSGTVLTWPSVPGRNYVVQFKASLASPDWTDAGAPTIATTATTSWTNAAAVPARFYRVSAW
ncbi:MAG TPA: hypothetical protein VNT26_04995, partial [Candidatus Sulfotelmatobacter sp.]|nr:hypothetical protein [Candidatus Sulfotelmatobacter sp.]